MNEFHWGVFLLGFSAIFLSAVLQALSGFGFGLFAVPLLCMFFEPKMVVAAMLLHGTMLNITVLSREWRHVQPRRIVPLAIFALFGIPFGTWLLTKLSQGVVLGSIGLFIITFSALLLLGFRFKFKNEKLVTPVVGFISGVFNGLSSLSGPPVVLFFANMGTDEKRLFRANLIAYFLLVNLFTIPGFIIGGILTENSLKLAFYMTPALFLGIILGMLLHHRLSEAIFKKIALWSVLAAGLLAFAKGMYW